MPENFDSICYPLLRQTHADNGKNGTEAGDLVIPQTTEWSIREGYQLWEILEHIKNEYRKEDLPFPDNLWFRGHSREKYVLLPSLIRTYFDNKITCSLPQYQKMLLEKFTARSREATELHDSSRLKRDNEQIEYLADMQHYGVPTSLMDWGEDIGVALYMATEKNYTDSKNAIFVLHPYFYNYVRNKIILFYNEKRVLFHRDENDRYNRETANAEIGNILPNFSSHFNLTAKQYINYITGPEVYCSPRTRHRSSDPLKTTSTYAPMLPLAIQIPRNNPRIRNQSGHFLAFNLCELPLKDDLRTEEDCYHGFEHVELTKVQEFYMSNAWFHNYLVPQVTDGSNACRAMEKRIPFLHKIIIENNAVGTIKEYVECLGKRKETVYPELYHIGRQIASEAKGI